MNQFVLVYPLVESMMELMKWGSGKELDITCQEVGVLMIIGARHWISGLKFEFGCGILGFGVFRAVL